jgi:hypothetical protein
MAAVLIAEDVVRRIAVECAYVDERGGVGIRIEPAAAMRRRRLKRRGALSSPAAMPPRRPNGRRRF